GLELADAPKDIGRLWAELRDSFAFDHRTLVLDLCNMPADPFGRAGWAGVLGLIIRPSLRMPGQIALVTNETRLPGLPVVKDPVRNALKLDPQPLESMELLDSAWKTIAHEI